MKLACIVFSNDLAGEVLSGKMILVPLWRFRRQLVRLLFEKLLRIRFVDLLALSRCDTVLTPLPQLGSTDFSSCSILLKHRQPTSVNAGTHLRDILPSNN